MEKRIFQLFTICFFSLIPSLHTYSADEITDLSDLSEETQVLDAPKVDATTELPSKNAQNSEAESDSSFKKNAKVLSEEDLLKVEKKKVDVVKSDKISESDIYIQDAEKYRVDENFKTLKLNDVIEQGLRKNYNFEISAKKFELAKLQFESSHDAFWYPNIKLQLSTSTQSLSTIRSSDRTPSSPYSKIPNGTFGLSLGDYTVFNWGKDFSIFLNSKMTFEREKNKLDEEKRELKLSLIQNFFELMYKKNLEKIQQEKLRQVSFVYRLSKEKITIGKTSKQDYYQARSSYLEAQNSYHQAKIDTDELDSQMTYLIADPPTLKYTLIEKLDYKRIKISLEESLELTQRNNPTLLNNQVALENYQRSYEVALKENLPLPKLSMNLGAYNKYFGPSSNRTIYDTYGGSGKVDLVASINATWDIIGEDGFFNSRKTAIARMNKEISQFEKDKNIAFLKSTVRETYKNILSLQNQMLILDARMVSVQKAFDTILDNYLNNRVRYYEYSMAHDDLISTKILAETVKFEHLKEKLNLAKLMGVEDFSGENFEHLAVKARESK